jgi:hypothetical protein
MAEVTRAEFDALVARVGKLELAIQPVEPLRREVQVQAKPVDGASVQVSWTVTLAEEVELFTVGRDGRDSSGAGAWSSTMAPAARSLLFNKLLPRHEYTFSVTAVYRDGEAVTGSAKATPAGDSEPDVDPEVPGERRVPYVANRDGGSRLPFNRLVFTGGAPSLDALKRFERDAGGKVDGAMTFPPRRSWADLRRSYGDAKAILDSGGIVVVSIPHAPESEGDTMNQRGANDAYRDEQRELGKWWADQGLNSDRFAIRLGWEFNGNWYAWSANRPGGPAVLRESIRHFVTNVRAGGATKVRFNLCANKGPSQSKAHFPEVFPGADIIDVVGIDMYDMWAPTFTDADWERELTKAPTPAFVADFARQHGIQWSWDEGGNSWDAKSGGKDNPFYWAKRWEFLNEHAESCAWDVTYLHPGAPASLKHDFPSNPRSWAAYKSLYVPA